MVYYSGPLIAYGIAKSGLGEGQPGPTKYRDIDLNDFRHVADYFISCRWNRSPPPYPPSDTKVKGVRINCSGDERSFRKPHFEEIEVSMMDVLTVEYDTSDIAKRIGLPVFTKPCPPDPSWAKNSNAYVNEDATYLHLCMDSKAKPNNLTGVIGWGYAPLRWQNRVGSVIVVRQDQKPLSRWHMEALCKYCREEVTALLEHNIWEFSEIPEDYMSKHMILSMICRPMFHVFWRRWRDEKIEKGDESLWDVDLPHST
ncbi:hypothetical protein F5B22DRAFT_612171 [Xylaria bambusicola]|uniref:uncharacterized protein n=1 Tax=Xylaria bambusicola TaxID=326684 RepID=UPI002008E1EF|nr:uncharacterized protein F5B22DRAFT_612171 [Xylaria bambusicola]KAI0513088.1 hypothetical protein F5B22DRAFT_612171 [Xylaria bambusicola]